MKVGHFLDSKKSDLITCTPDETVAAAANLLASNNIGALLVCTPLRTLVGIISERDFVRAFASDPKGFSGRLVRELMTREIIVCDPNESMSEAERRMNEHRIRHLPVVDGDDLVGMLSIRDVIAVRLMEARQEIDVLRDVVIAARHN